MKEQLSALMDGEMDGNEAARLLKALDEDEGLRAAWGDYHLIGEVLRANRQAGLDVSGVVRERLKAEPTVLAPRRMRRPLRSRTMAGAAALAATVSFAAVVSWQHLGTGTGPVTAVVAERAVPVSTPRPLDDSDPYLLAHQEMTTDSDVVKVGYARGVRH